MFLSNFIMFSQCEPTSLIIDPSFEIGGPTFEEGCSSTPEDSCVWQVNDGGEITNEIAYDGIYSWKTNAGSAYQEAIELSPNTDYILSCWINTMTTSEYSVTISNTSETFATGVWVGPTDGWEMVSLSFTTASDNLSVMLELACYTDTAYFDFFELCGSSILTIDDETLLSTISMYPNPTKGVVTINLNTLEEDERVDLKVFNSIGQLVFQDKVLKQDNYQFHLNEASGLYFIEVTSKDKKHYFKLIKK